MTRPNPSRWSRILRRAGVAALAVGFATALLAQDAPEPAQGDPGVLPPYLKGINLDLPIQTAFRAWPPKELEERPYWLPWASMSFQRASIFNRPILLIVTVPWNRYAQRMMKEALADPLVLRTLNIDYVSIVVRADRHPDVYARYGTGNWPAISLLLPDGSPMLSQVNPKNVALPITVGFTDSKTLLFNLNEGKKYFDKWQNVLNGVSQVYEKRVDLEETKAGTADAKAIEPVVKWIAGNADAKHGGFGVAPKYALEGLMEWGALRDDRQQPAVSTIGRNTLAKLIASPLYDTTDGGFHRMAVAPDWAGIQYEKMLEGNVDLMREMVFALREEDDPTLRQALASSVKFVTTVLARPGGGFYLGQEADSKSKDGGGYWTAATRDPANAPATDKLVLAGPNASAGAALLRAGALLGDEAATKAGKAALDLVLEKSFQPNRGVNHVVEPDPGSGRYLETQADTAFAFEDAYESTGDPRYLAAAKDIVGFVRNNMKSSDETAFHDHVPTGFEFGLLDMPLRPIIDNARLTRVLIRLDLQGATTDGHDAAKEVLATFSGDLADRGARAIIPGLAIDELVSEPMLITIEGSADDPAAASLRRAALNAPHGWVVIRSAPAPAAGASISWRGASRHVTDPSALASEVRALAAGVVGAP